MAYISFQPSDFYNTSVQWEGNDSTQTISGIGFQPALTWVKAIDDTTPWGCLDAVRGSTKWLRQNDTTAEETKADGITSFNADGFAIGANGYLNDSNYDYRSWNWKMGTTSGLSGGTLTPSAYSINTTAKQGIYKYTGTGSIATIAHGLGQAPSAIFIKKLSGTDSWASYQETAGNTKCLALDTNAALETGAGFWGNTSPTSTVFSIKDNSRLNTSGQDYVAYAFCDVPGYFRQGSYIGNGNVSGPMCFTGFSPSLLFLKNDASGEGWFMVNNKSNPYNVVNKNLFANTSGAEATNGTAASDKNLDFLANGFKIRTTNSEVNSDAATYRYWAWGGQPLIGSGGTAGVAQ